MSVYKVISGAISSTNPVAQNAKKHNVADNILKIPSSVNGDKLRDELDTLAANNTLFSIKKPVDAIEKLAYEAYLQSSPQTTFKTMDAINNPMLKASWQQYLGDGIPRLRY